MKALPDCVDAHSPKLIGRIPFKLIVADDGSLFFKWIYIGDKVFSDPFFDDSMTQCLSLPQNSHMPFTTAQTLIDVAAEIDAVAPSAFIFHVSRCGSTLLAQMLSMDERNIVLSEVPLLDAILRLPFSNPEIKNPLDQELFRAILKLLGKKRSGQEKYLFLKTDSWHLFSFEKLRQWYPTIPALLLFRSPREVIRSQEKLKGMHAVQGIIQLEAVGFDRTFDPTLSMEEYLEKVLENYFTQCLKILDNDILSHAVSYHDGAMEMIHRIATMCNIQMSSEMFARMEKRTAHHSKHPEKKFNADIPLPHNSPNTKLEKLFEEMNEKKQMRLKFIS